jgi:hypothetical protein
MPGIDSNEKIVEKNIQLPVNIIRAIFFLNIFRQREKIEKGN